MQSVPDGGLVPLSTASQIGRAVSTLTVNERLWLEPQNGETSANRFASNVDKTVRKSANKNGSGRLVRKHRLELSGWYAARVGGLGPYSTTAY